MPGRKNMIVKMAGPPAVAKELACQLIPMPSPPLKPASDCYPRWVCSLPGLNRFPQLWQFVGLTANVQSCAMRFMEVDRAY